MNAWQSEWLKSYRQSSDLAAGDENNDDDDEQTFAESEAEQMRKMRYVAFPFATYALAWRDQIDS